MRLSSTPLWGTEILLPAFYRWETGTDRLSDSPDVYNTVVTESGIELCGTNPNVDRSPDSHLHVTLMLSSPAQSISRCSCLNCRQCFVCDDAPILVSAPVLAIMANLRQKSLMELRLKIREGGEEWVTFSKTPLTFSVIEIHYGWQKDVGTVKTLVFFNGV